MALSEERSCAEALMMACDERLGAQSPAALMVCDTFLAHDFWTSFARKNYLPVASQVWAWGYNGGGQLGLGDKKSREKPAEVPALHGRCIHAIACGYGHTMAVIDDGELWATGSNFFGQLGLGDKETRSSFTRIMALSGHPVAAVACGSEFTLAVLESGELLSWGGNTYGQLGLHDVGLRLTPNRVRGFGEGKCVAAVVCGTYHSTVALETGEVFAWGFNNHGQLGLGDTTERNAPAQVMALAGKHIVALSCGEWHTAALSEAGELYTWGHGQYGKLGHRNDTSIAIPRAVEAFQGRPVKTVVCGVDHTFALLRSGELFAWGINGKGQLGLPTSSPPVHTPERVSLFDGRRILAIQCHEFSAAVLQDSGEIYVWGFAKNVVQQFLKEKKGVGLAIGHFRAFVLVK